MAALQHDVNNYKTHIESIIERVGTIVNTNNLFNGIKMKYKVIMPSPTDKDTLLFSVKLYLDGKETEEYCNVQYYKHEDNEYEISVSMIASTMGNSTGSLLFNLQIIVALLFSETFVEFNKNITLDNCTDDPVRAMTGIYKRFKPKELSMEEWKQELEDKQIEDILPDLSDEEELSREPTYGCDLPGTGTINVLKDIQRILIKRGLTFVNPENVKDELLGLFVEINKDKYSKFLKPKYVETPREDESINSSSTNQLPPSPIRRRVRVVK